MKKSFLYTRTGDKGSTSLVGGMRVAKNSPRVCAYGDVDELNAQIGLVASVAASERGAEHDVALLTHVSYVMFNIGAHLASPPDPHLPTASEAPVSDGEIIALEQRIDTLDALLPPQRTFILPAGVWLHRMPMWHGPCAVAPSGPYSRSPMWRGSVCIRRC